MQKRAALFTALFSELLAHGQNHLGTARFCLPPTITSGVEVGPVDPGATTTQHIRCCRHGVSNLIWVTVVKSTHADYLHSTELQPNRRRKAAAQRALLLTKTYSDFIVLFILMTGKKGYQRLTDQRQLTLQIMEPP